MIAYKKALGEVLEVLQIEGERYGPPSPEYYRSQLKFIASIPVPLQRAIARAGFSFSKNSPEEVDDFWQHVWFEASYFELLNQALFSLELKKLSLADWVRLAPWANRLENWAHSDALSGTYSALHELYPEKVTPTLYSWNKSDHPWLRRQSIVSLFYYARVRKQQPTFQKAKELVEPLITDQHFYVQRGVGWTLREMYHVYPEKTLALIKKHLVSLSSIACSAATEKLPVGCKKELMLVRKKERKRA
jgi:3-methyladenine DNA glycosylase AlkD